MVTRGATIDIAGGTAAQAGRGHAWRRARRLARQQPLGVIGLAIIVVMVVVAAAAPLVAPYAPGNSDFDVMTEPSWSHPFGTDRIGRDVFSRVVHGARTSMLVGAGSVAIAAIAGTVLGLVSGYFGRWVDTIIQRLVDIVMAFPFLVLALFIGAIAGRTTTNLIIVLGFAMTPGVIRVVRASVLTERARDYVTAATALGATSSRVMARHILPNIASAILVQATVAIPTAIIA